MTTIIHIFAAIGVLTTLLVILAVWGFYRAAKALQSEARKERIPDHYMDEELRGFPA